VGIVIDDAIVVLENIVRHLEESITRPWRRTRRPRDHAAVMATTILAGHHLLCSIALMTGQRAGM
jgi:multidrug efflux pump subunit AcrB